MAMSTRPGTAKRGPLGWGSLLLLMVGLPVVLFVGLTPWALHIGGRSTPFGQWSGVGELRASNGGKYVLFVQFTAGIMGTGLNGGRRGGGGMGHRDNLVGSARLCTQSGTTHTFKLTGVVRAWRTTEGATTSIALTHGEPVRLPSGWVVALHGRWQGPELELSSPDNSFTEVFTPRGEIRHVTSTADAGTAQVTLAYGTEDDFVAACGKIRGGPR
jgi:hypothetical protein